MLLEPALSNDLVELLAANFKTEEVNELHETLKGYETHLSQQQDCCVSLLHEL